MQIKKQIGADQEVEAKELFYLHKGTQGGVLNDITSEKPNCKCIMKLSCVTTIIILQLKFILYEYFNKQQII